jgi:hypothetical protein
MRAWVLGFAIAIATGCSSETNTGSVDAPPDGGDTVAPQPAPTGTAPTGTVPTGTAPTGTAPTGTAPTGTAPTGTAPTSTDAGAAPPGVDGATPPPDPPPGPAGPWPTADLTLYGTESGLGGPIIDANTDDAQNIWAVSPDTLYLLRPGQSHFARYTPADGLHVVPFVDPSGNPTMSWVTAVAGARANEVYVGYYGYESDNRFADTLAEEELGQADRVVVNADGSLTIAVRYQFRCDYEHSTCWENRSVRRMLFSHAGVSAGHLFIGFDHGVDHLFNDAMGDHIHVETWYHYPDGTVTEKQGEQFGLFVLPSGELWTAGAYGVGLQTWNADPHGWVDAPFRYAFTLFTPDHALDVAAGYREDNRGVAVTPDGTVWFASFDRGLWSWNPASGHYGAVRGWSAPGLPSAQLLDLAADPDGTLWIVAFDGTLVRFDPARASAQSWGGISDARRVWVDRSVTPRAVYVSRGSGLAIIRAK